MNRKNILIQLAALNIAHDATAPKSHLMELLKNSQIAAKNKISKVVNYAGGRGKIEVVFNKSTSEPVQVMVCEDIGKDAWTGDGITLADIRGALNGVESSRALDFFTNSPGGSVSEGVSIRNWLSQWKGEINNTIIGIAASTASWCIPAKNVRAYKNSQMFMHKSMGMTYGNADDHRKNIEFLDKTDSQIADMYAQQSGRPASEMMQMMSDETLLTGQEAMDAGLVDELIDGDAKNQFPAEWLNSAKQKLAALNSLRTTAPQNAGNNNNKQQTVIMNKDKMIALLNKWGVVIPENATDEQLTALVEAGKPIVAPENKKEPVAQLDEATKKRLENFEASIANQRSQSIRNQMEKYASEGRITVNQIDDYVAQAVIATDDPVKGNPILNIVKSHEIKTDKGVPPIPENVSKLTVEASHKDLAKGFEAYNEASKSLMRGNDVPMKDVSAAAIQKNLFFNKFKNRFMEMVNTGNTVDAGLQRQVIAQDVVIRDFARRVLSLDMFSTVFRNVPLEGTDVMDVPYYDLDSTASQAFAGTYSTLASATATGSRPITIGWGANRDGALGVGHARLVQALKFDSQEFNRQPYLKIAQNAALKAEKLAFDIFQDVLGVVTVANYPALLAAGNYISKTFDNFTSDDLADLKVACKAWPTVGRGLILDSAYDGNLIKDPSFKNAYQQAFQNVKVDGQLPNIYGFDYTENPNIPSNGAVNLRGLAFWKFAILVGFAPVPPVEEVRRAGTTWELLVDAATGVALEYRTFGTPDTDTAIYAIESSYGFAPGLKTAIKAIVTP